MARRVTMLLSGGLTAVVLSLLGEVAPVSSAGAAPASATKPASELTLSAASVVAGGSVQATGSVPPKQRRKVVLQSKTGGSWTKVDSKKTNKKGRFAFSYHANVPGPVSLRVYAPKTTIKGKSYPAITTKARPLTVTAAPTPPTPPPPPPPPPAPGAITAVSHGDEQSYIPVISGDGRYVAFSSLATDLVAGDTNNLTDVFLYDRQTGVTTQVTEGDNFSYVTSISGDGRYVAFSSHATNLVGPGGDTNNKMDVFVYDRVGGDTVKITNGDGDSFDPSISADGKVIAFTSHATDLPGATPDSDAAAADVFLHDEDLAGTFTRITNGSEISDDSGHPSTNADGSFVAFESWAALDPADTHDGQDVYLYDRGAASTTVVSEAGNNQTVHASISLDGRFVAFESLASNLVTGDTNGRWDIFVYDRTGQALSRITDGNDHTHHPSISGDGRYVGFQSDATNLVAGDTNDVADVFVHDRNTSTAVRIGDGNDFSDSPALSSTGRFVAFDSMASDLTAAADTNGVKDVFVWDRDN